MFRLLANFVIRQTGKIGGNDRCGEVDTDDVATNEQLQQYVYDKQEFKQEKRKA